MLGKELRKARLAAGLTQEQLGLKARISREHVNDLERDKKSPTVKTLVRLCKVMNVQAWQVMRRAEEGDL